MNTSITNLSTLMRRILRMVSPVLSLAILAAEPVGASITALGLPRLKSETQAGRATGLDSARFTVDRLSIGDFVGVAQGRRNSVDYLALDGGKEWSRPLRGTDGRIVSASFLALGSQSTVIDVGGARLGLTGSLADNNLQLMYDDASAGTPQWRSLGLYLPVASYDGHSMAAPPILTVQIDPVEGVWHIYAGTRLLADHLPLLPKADRKFSIKAGAGGAWICGLVQADENPIYDDANGNGVDDAFEKEQRGGTILPAGSGLAERRLFARQWKTAQRTTHPPSVMSAIRPVPDGR